MGIVLIVIGIGWALLGAGNILTMLSRTQEVGGVETFGFLLNMILFVLPGLIVGGIGEMLRRRSARGATTSDGSGLIACPDCGSGVSVHADHCLKCGRPVATMASPAALRSASAPSDPAKITPAKVVAVLVFAAALGFAIVGTPRHRVGATDSLAQPLAADIALAKQQGGISDSAQLASRADGQRIFTALRPHFHCAKDSIYNSAGWFTHQNQTVDNSYDRSYLAAPVNTNGDTYLQSDFTGSDWIFHEQVVVKIAGSGVFESAAVRTYDRDNHETNGSGSVWETISFTNGRDNGILDAIVLNPDSQATVRFEGRSNRRDMTLAKRDRVAISESVKLARAIKAVGGVTCATR